MVFGHNCTIWLHLEFRGLGSAWFFSAHLLFFHARDQMFGAQDLNFGSRINMLAQGPFGGKNMVPQKVVLQ